MLTQRIVSSGSIGMWGRVMRLSSTSSAAHKDFSLERKMTCLELQHLKRKGKKIAMITAYDYPSVSS